MNKSNMSKMKNAFGKMTHIFLIITMCVDMKKDAPAEIYKLAQCQLNPACGGFERMGVVNNL